MESIGVACFGGVPVIGMPVGLFLVQILWDLGLLPFNFVLVLGSVSGSLCSYTGINLGINIGTLQGGLVFSDLQVSLNK